MLITIPLLRVVDLVQDVGVTSCVANNVADGLGGDVVEIAPLDVDHPPATSRLSSQDTLDKKSRLAGLLVLLGRRSRYSAIGMDERPASTIRQRDCDVEILVRGRSFGALPY